MLKLNKNNNLNYYSTILAFLLLSFSIILFLLPNVVFAVSEHNVPSDEEKKIGNFIEQCDRSESKEIQAKSDTNNSSFELDFRKIIQSGQEEATVKDVVLTDNYGNKIVRYTRSIVGDTVKVFQKDILSKKDKVNLTASKTINNLTEALFNAYTDATHRAVITHTTDFITDEVLSVDRWDEVEVDRFVKAEFDYDTLQGLIVKITNGLYNQSVLKSRELIKQPECQFVIDYIEHHMIKEIASVVNGLWYK
ncbi:hypothetical protein [Candidatus Phytoplasma palmae]|uniref:hypothetical protein n=1 Tax=Candidatus Phytoplasma palmae TaxID=85624 RepID=UPI003990D0DE